ncbi:unnamed protein product, partial [Leptidea sinapis]
MGDSKEVKFIMPYKPKKPLDVQTWQSTAQQDINTSENERQTIECNEAKKIVQIFKDENKTLRRTLRRYKYSRPLNFNQYHQNFEYFTDRNGLSTSKLRKPEIGICSGHLKTLTKFNQRNIHFHESDKIANFVSVTNLFKSPCKASFVKNNWFVYRCQLKKEDACCCSCNSDAMFEVMKSLYDCYKKKNCDDCKCILCGHLPRAERRFDEHRKSPSKLVNVGVGVKEKKRVVKKSVLSLKGKTKSEMENKLREAALAGVRLPEGKTKSEKQIIQKVKTDLGLPQLGKTKSEKEILDNAHAAGLIIPLEGKNNDEKETILRMQAKLGIPLPEGRTKSEKALIKQIKSTQPTKIDAAEKLRKAKENGYLTPINGKSLQDKEKIIKGLAMLGLLLPKGVSESENNIIDKVRKDVGLPIEPKTSKERKIYNKGIAVGIITPLEGKSNRQKEKIIKQQAMFGVPLPEGRTASEKSLIAKIKKRSKPLSVTSATSEVISIPSAKIKKAKAEGLFTPLKDKNVVQRENILKGLAFYGIPLPKGETDSQQNLINKVRRDLGLPLEPKTPAEKKKYKKAAAAGGLAMNGIPLPEAKSESERKLVDKVRKDLGLPGEPKTRADKSKYKKAVAAGLITPLEGKSFPEKEKLLKGMVNAGFSLPEGRTTSEKLLIARIHDTGKKIKKAKAEGLLTPLQGKSNESKEKILRGLAMHGIPLPEGQTPSENAIIDKVRDDLGLPIPPTIGSDKEKYAKAQATGIITPLEGKLKPEKEKILRAQAALGIPLPKGRTPSERVLIKRIIETPPEQLIFSEIPKEDKEKILKDLAMQGEVFPVPANDSEKKILEKVRRDLGLPPEPKSTLEKNKYNKAQAAGIIVPLQGKSRSQREIILQKEADFGLELPEGRTASEKELVNNVKRRRIKRLNYLKKLDTKTAKNITEGKGPSDECICGLLTPEAPIDTKKEKTLPSEILKDAADAGLFTPLKGKSPEQKEKIIKGLALQGLPLPKEESPSDKILIDKVRKEIGLPPEPKSSLLKDKYNLAQIAGIITPLEGKTKAEKKKILTKLAELGIPLPEGRSNSETDLINEISATVPRRITSDKFRKARSDGLLTPITGKPFSEKERILRALATLGLPLPVGKTSSEKKIIHKIKSDLGVTTVPIPPEKLQQAKAAGLLTPLTGKTESQKKKIVKELALLGIPIPKAQTVSDKKIIEKVRKDVGLPPEPKTSSLRDKYKYAELAGIIKPLEGKTPVEKKNLLTKQAEIGIPLPEGRTQSEKDLIRMIQASVPKKVTSEKIRKAMAAGILTPITGKSQNEKERILRVLASEGLPLPEGQTTSDKKLIQKIKSEMGITSSLIPSEILRKAKAAGLLTPLKGKTYPQKEKVVKGLALHGIPLPTAQTASEKQIIDKVRKDVGLPPEPKSSSVKNRYKQAQKSGFITPLEGKSKAQKENILRKQAAMGIPLPEGRTQSEKDLINKIRKEIPKHVASERLRKAKAAGLLTPLRGKTPEEKSKILEKLAKSGLPLPKGKTPSEKLLISKLRSEMGIPLDGISSEMLRKAEAAGLITPLTGKSIQQKEKILKGRVAAGLPLPKGMSPSDQALVKKFKEKTENISPLTKKSKISIPSEKIKAAKEAGLITPLKGKSPEQKEKIIKGLAMRGIPLPRPETPSEIEIVDKVRKDVGLPQEPKSSSLREKYKLGHVAGIMTPLEGKTASQKKIILRKQAELGIPLPEGRTKSEKDIIKAIQDTIPKKVTSEKIRKSKATRTLTGKRTAEGLPLREGKTSSEKKIVKKIQSDMSIIAVPNLSDKLKKAKAAGLLTPLKGKTVPEKEKILKRLALLGIPLPKGQTASEKKIIDKVWKDVGLPPEPKTSLIKNKYREAQLNGIITPLEGKSVSQKENILMKLAEMGIPLPEGRTKTEKDLIAKVQAKFPADLYEKGVQTKSRKVGLGPVKRSEIGVGVSGKSQAGIREKFEDIVKTTKCDRGCGCDRKKIRFKHSYVKIRVTSPDISSLCPCPDECLPGVKTGVFTDSEGIKVTVGHATGSTSFDYKKWRVQTGSRSHLTLTDLTEKKNSKFHLKLTHNDKKVLSTTRSYPYLKKYLKAARYAQNSVSHVETITDVTSNITTSSNSIFSFCFGRKSSSASFKTNTSLNSDDMISMISYSISSSISSSISEETDLLNYLYCKKKEKISVEDLLNEYSTNLKYRCQYKTKEETCCCSCNSDAMFEVMKSLYDCYKKKNCDNCNCILCGHLPREERRLGELRKSGAELASAGIGVKQKKKKLKKKSVPSIEDKTKADKRKTIVKEEKFLEKQAVIDVPPSEGKISKLTLPSEKMMKAKKEGLLTPLKGKSPEQKEKILRGLAMNGIPLPKGKSQSERHIIEKVRLELGLPPEPKTQDEKIKYKKGVAAGLIVPLEGKSQKEKEELLKQQANLGMTLPEGRSASEKAIINKIKETVEIDKTKLFAPSEVKSIPSEKISKLKAEGLLTPLKGKSPKQKEKIFRGLAINGIPLPKAKTDSERQIIEKKAIPSETINKLKAEGLLTPLKGKNPEQKEKVLRGWAINGIPLPKAKTDSERKIIEKVRQDLGLPPEPKTSEEKKNYKKAVAAGLVVPLEGKANSEKEKLLKEQAKLGIRLPVGRTASEKALITKLRESTKHPIDISVPSDLRVIPSTKIKKARAAGLLTPLNGKSTKQKEKILRGLALNGIPLPKAKTDSERKLITKIRKDLGLPPEPSTAAEKSKYKLAIATGLITPLEGKTLTQKQKLLQDQAKLGIPLPEGRTKSEKAFISQLRDRIKEKTEMKELVGKTNSEKERNLKTLAKQGFPLPSGKTTSEIELIAKVRDEIGLPPAPLTTTEKEKYEKAHAAGLITPLEGKSKSKIEKLLKEQAALGLTLPKGRTPSERELIQNIHETTKEKLDSIKKTNEEKEVAFKRLANQGNLLPDGKTKSEQKILDKVRYDLGLPPKPKSKEEKNKYNKAHAAGIIVPLEGKSESEKKNILQQQADFGLELPEARTASERELIKKVMKKTKKRLHYLQKLDTKTAKIMREGKGPSDKCICDLLTPEADKIVKDFKKEEVTKIPTEKLKIAKETGLLTPLRGKSPEQKEKIIKGMAMQGIPFPQAETTSENDLINKVIREIGLPPKPKSSKIRKNYEFAQLAGIITPLEGKTKSERKIILTKQAELGIPLPEGRTQSEKDLINRINTTVPKRITSETIRKAISAGIFTPITGKPAKEKDRILRTLAAEGLPLPVGKTASEKKLIRKIESEMGVTALYIPPEKQRKAKAAGLLTPLKGKTKTQKEEIVKGLALLGIPLPKAQTSSEKKIIDKVRKDVGLPPEPKSSSLKEKYKYAQEAGFLTPLEVRDLAMLGIPLPKPQTASEKNIIDKVRKDVGLPPEPKSSSLKEKHKYAQEAGFLTPLEGKSAAQKKKILTKQAQLGIPLPEARTQTEKDLIKTIQATVPKAVTSEKLRTVKAAGLLTPLTGKPPKEQERILRNLAAEGLPLPEGKTASEKQLIRKIESEIGITAAPIPSEKLRKAKAAGILTPLKGKTNPEKEKIVRELALHGIPLPRAQTPSEKKIIDKVRKDVGLPPEPVTSSLRDKYRYAQETGILTPLEGKTTLQKKKILTKQAQLGIPLPEGRTLSEKDLIKKIQATVPKIVTSEKLRNIKAAGLLTPIGGKPTKEKEKILRHLAHEGLPLPDGKTLSEKQIIHKIKSELGLTTSMIPSEKLRKAMAAGLLTPLKGKSDPEKEKILRELVLHGIPLPTAQTASENKMIDKVRRDLGLPPEPQTSSLRSKYKYAQEAGLLTPLEGKTADQKKSILTKQARLGIPLPDGRTKSEQDLIKKIQATVPKNVTSEKLRKVKAAGLLTPLTGKSQKEKERILRNLAAEGLPLPEGRTASEKQIIQNIKDESGIAAVPIPSEKLRKARAAGLLTPLEGKTRLQQENIIKELALLGMPLPKAQSNSEKKIIDKVRKDLGLPPEPKSSSIRDKYINAQAAGIITPLQGKTATQKEKILTKLAEIGIPLPEGRTKSEKELIKKIEATKPTKIISDKLRKAKASGLLKPVSGKLDESDRLLRTLAAEGLPLPKGKSTSQKELSIPSYKLLKAKAAGLLTPLKGKSDAEKENIVRQLALLGIPLPKAQSASEKRVIDNVRKDLGLPPEPTTSLIKEKYRQAQKEGIITTLEGKSKAQKEQILKKQADIGIPLPEGRTQSEKDLINKLRREQVTASKLRKARAAGLLSPLEGKPSKEKEKILRNLAKSGLPLPEGGTPSEKRLIQRIRKEMGVPLKGYPSEKLRKALAEGLITPLEGKTAAQKEMILRGRVAADLPLPETMTPSEKELVERIRVSKKPESKIVTSEKEKMLTNLAMLGKPLPEAKTTSESKLINKIRQNLGIPPEPKTKRERQNYRKAYAEGIIQPLEGKTLAQKAKILEAEADMGLELPEGRSSSEKSLIQKIKSKREKGTPKLPEKLKRLDIKSAKYMKEGKGPSDECICDLLTPVKDKSEKLLPEKFELLQGKPDDEKEKIIRELALLGKPLPEPQSASEKKIIDKVLKEVGLIAPLEGKTSLEKEKILTKQGEMGIPSLEARTQSTKVQKTKDAGTMSPLAPLEGKTRSEKSLLKKVKVQVGLPPEPSSQKRVKSKSKKIGITKSKKSETQIGVGKSKFGVVEELQDITKTTTCDRACGCDRKKIRFKHSYVKIRVTSPDISSLCPCPDECVPGVKGGVFTDNEGIKVTVGQATVTPSFRSTELDNVDDEISLKVNSTFNLENNALTSSMNHNRIKIVDLKWSMSFPLPGKYLSNNIDISSSSSKHSISCNYIESKESDTRTNDLFFPIKLPLEVNNSNTMFYFGTTNSSISLKTTSSFRSSETFSVISFSITDISSNTSCMSEKLLEDLLDYLTCKKKNIEHLADECYADSTY